MALCNSGSMSLGGSTTGRSVNCELGRSGTSSINMNDSEVRALAERSSGSICMSNFYGKSNLPDTIGQEFGGGYYMGTVTVSSSNYLLLLSPIAGNLPTFSCQSCWKTTDTGPDTGNEQFDGFGNTHDHLNSATFPAGNWTLTRSINGCSDWYLPATCELCTIHSNMSSIPSAHCFCDANYWASSEPAPFNCTRACRQFMRVGIYQISTNSKSSCAPAVRAIRREAF